MNEKKKVRDVARVNLGQVKGSDNVWHTVEIVIRTLLEPLREAIQIHVDLGIRQAWVSFALLVEAYRSPSEIRVRDTLEVFYNEAKELYEVTVYAPFGQDGKRLGPKVAFALPDDVLNRAMKLRDVLVALREEAAKQGFAELVDRDGRVVEAPKPASKPTEAKATEKKAEAPKAEAKATEKILSPDKAAELQGRVVPPAEAPKAEAPKAETTPVEAKPPKKDMSPDEAAEQALRLAGPRREGKKHGEREERPKGKKRDKRRDRDEAREELTGQPS